jgi:hypothetical protein
LITDFGSLLAKSGRDVVTIDTLDGTLALFSGVAPRTLAGTVVVAAAWGGWRLCRGKPWLVRMLFVATAAQAVVVGLSGAQIVTAPSVFSRYCLTALPLFLLALAAAIAASAAALGRRLRAARPITLVVAPLLLLALGPWRQAYWFPNQWTNHPVLQADYGLHRDEIERTFFPAGISGAYALLSGLPPGSITIVETPFPHGFPANPYPILQRHHRQRVIGGFGGELGTGELPGWPPGRGREPRWTASLTDLDGLRRRGARFVFVHRDLQAEFPRLTFERPPVAAPSERFLRERLGEPLFADRWVAVFDLAR